MRFAATHTNRADLTLLVVAAVWGATLVGCPSASQENEPPRFANRTDKTNANASYVVGNACRQCHENVAVLHDVHPHAQALTAISGGAPVFPGSAGSMGVAEPPEGFAWSDIAYLVGGYTKRALFVDQAGYLLTSGETGVDTQWNLSFPANGTLPGFGPFLPTATEPQPYDYSAFAFRSTGAVPFDESAPQFQDNRPGMRGGWAEHGVQCEACHGPGGNHFFTVDDEVVIDRNRIFVDPDGSETCAQCHSRPFGDTSGVIPASNGFIASQSQWSELKASGGHASFSCTVCHDPHRSITYDRANAIRNDCTVCHTRETMAGHRDAVFRKGDYTEVLSCASCHMPFATREGTSAGPDFAGPDGRVGDTRTHIFRISTEPVDYTGMFTDDGTQVRRDGEGRAKVTVDFVCIRCHNGGDLFSLTVSRAAEIAPNVHKLPE